MPFLKKLSIAVLCVLFAPGILPGFALLRSATATPAPSISKFYATHATITSGASDSLLAYFSNGTGVITPGNLAVTSGTAVSVTPTSSTTYTLTVTGTNNAVVTRTVTVAVVPAPAITSLTASPTPITIGSTSKITAVFANGTGVLTPGSLTVTSGTPVTVTPTATTTYTLKVTNAAGTVVAKTVPVTVDAVPTITSLVTAAPAITDGKTTTLTAVFAHGTGVLTPGNLTLTSGRAVTLKPTATTTYTLTVTNSAGAAVSQQTSLTVDAAPVITSFVEGAASIKYGASTTLTGVFANGTGVVTPGNLALTSGTPITVSPTATTTYTLTVSNVLDTTTTKAIKITVIPPVPAAPTALVATPGNQLVTLGWTAPEYATSFKLLRATATAGPFTLIGTTTSEIFEDDTVVNNTRYYYEVQAVDSTGTSVASAQAAVTPMAPPTAATSLAATLGDGEAKLSWTAGSGAVTYTVARAAVSGGPYSNVGSVSGTSYADASLTNGAQYYYVVYAVNPVGTSAASNQVEAIPMASPTGVVAAGSDAQIALAWDPVVGATSYNIYEGASSSGVSTLLVSTQSTRYTNTGLTDGVTRDYDVVAVNSTGNSAASAVVSATPSASGSSTMLIADPKVGLGTWFMNDWDQAKAFADLMKQSRTWRNSAWNGDATLDANGWPMQDASTVIDTYPFALATYKLVFNGKATVTPNWFDGTVTNMTYNAATNTSTADVNVTGEGAGYINLVFTNTQRTASSATNTGFTNAHLYQPGYATDGSQVFSTPFLNAMGKVTTIRMMDWTGTNNNYVVNWADRSLPGSASQASSTTTWTGPDGTVYTGGGGVALEYQIQLCNTLQVDCYINVPVVASDDFVTKMALALAYGTDGVNPYTSKQANPVHAPLNANLRVYLEYANEVWNYSAGVFGVVQNICGYLPANHPLVTVDYDASNIGIYQQIYRYPAWRMANISQIFASIFGQSQMMTRVRPLLETQQGDANGTLDLALQFVDAYAKTLTPATTVNGLIYGGGGSAYYGVINSNSAAVDSIFAAGNYPDPNTLTAWELDSTWLHNYGIKHVAYEGGPGINSAFSDASNKLINADPRMETMVDTYQTAWDEMGGDLLIYYDVAGSTAWEFTPDITNTDTPKFAALADIQSSARSAVTVGPLMPGTMNFVDQSTGTDAFNIRTDYGYDNTIGSGTKKCTVTNSTGAFIAYPVHTTAAFTGTLSITGVGDYANVGSSTKAENVEVWINGVDQGAITIPATTNDTEVSSSKLTVNMPAGLDVVRFVATSGTFSGCTLTITQP